MPKKIGKLTVKLTTGAARWRNLVYVAATSVKLDREHVAHTFFLANKDGVWSECGRENWSSVGMTIVRKPGERMLAVSEDGDVFTYGGGVGGTEVIEPRPVALRGVTCIDGQAVAYGMRRQAYIRSETGSWRAIHAPDCKPGEAAGFEGLCGWSLLDLYAVGWEGEIWHFNGSTWVIESSPVNVILTAATIHDDGFVYACGQNGTLVRGRVGQWEVLAANQTIDDFWAIASYQGQLYVASLGMLYVLTNGQLLTVSTGIDQTGSFQALSEAQGVLWSIGSDDIAATDGKQWVRVL